MKNVTVLTSPLGSEGEDAAIEGISFSFGKEEVAGTSFGDVGASAVAGAGLLELGFAFFRGGSIYPSSLHKKKCVVISAV
jgi:hypothetical protein